MKLRLSVLLAAGIMSAAMARAEDKPPTLDAPTSAAMAAMGKALSANGFSFRDQSIREYTDANGQPLHIVHHASVLVRRPDHLKVDVEGDDGASKLVYDGKTVSIYNQTANKYLSVPFTGPLEKMLQETSERLGVDFPLADLLTPTPDKAFLAGVTSGTRINAVTIDGVPAEHLLFMQPPGIELELWLEEKTDLPRRLIVTYRSLPGEPRFIAAMSDWKLGLNPPDSEFAFTPPNGATKIEPKGPTQ